jgi:hypothetical protein
MAVAAIKNKRRPEAAKQQQKARRGINRCPQKMLPMLNQDNRPLTGSLRSVVLVCAWVRFSCGNN